MDRSLCLRRFVAVLLCCLLAFHQTLPVARAVEPISASLTIAAGAVALGGLSAAAVESTIGPQVAAIIGTTMEGLGTSVYTAEDSALTKTKFIMSKIAVWSVQAKMAKEDFYKAVASGVSVAGNGVIQLSHDASKLISQFISWLFETGQVSATLPEVSPSFSTASSSLSLSIPQPFTFLQNTSASTYNVYYQGGESVRYELHVPSDVSITLYTNRDTLPDIQARLIFASTSPFEIGSLSFGSGSERISSSSSYTLNGSTVHHCEFAISRLSGTTPEQAVPWLTANVGISGGLSGFADIAWSSIYGTIVSPDNPGIADDVFVGSEADWAQNKDLLNPSIDNVTTITPDLINKLIDQLADGQTATMDIATYLDSLVDAFDGLKAQVAEITDTLTGIQESLAVPDSLTSTVTNESEDPDSDPSYEPEKVDPPGVVENLRYPLKDYFPFCIPFDLYALFQIFNADPVAPAFTIDYTFPVGNGIPIHIAVDLSDWDSLASTVRFLEVVSFIVGLAVATRRLFIRV